MEYLRKKEERTDILLRFFASDEVVCFDVSPNQDCLVCECSDGTIHLWSLRTGQLMWTSSALVSNLNFRGLPEKGCLSPTPFYRSVVFHPTLNLILQGTLCQSYTLVGDVKPLFRSSKCRFLVCSISGDKTTMLTDCLNGRNCVIQWSLKDGSKISRFTHKCEILSFAWSACGRRMVIVDSDKCAYLIDMNDGVETLICPSVWSRYVKLTPDCRFFFCLLSDEAEHNWDMEPKLFCLDIDRNTKSMYSLDCIFGTSSYQYASEFETCNESGFLSGDPFWFSDTKGFPPGDFALVLEKQMLLRVSPHSKVIEMCRLNDVREWRGESSDEAGQSIEPGDITTERAENNDLTEHNLPEINNMPEDGFVEINYLAGYVYFSVDGDSLYTVTVGGIQIINLVAGDVLSKRIREKEYMIFAQSLSVVPVKRGVLFRTVSGSLELWNSDLSVCMKSWTEFHVDDVVPLSEERVALATVNDFDYRKEVIILDTTSEKNVSTIANFEGEFLACNKKWEVLTTTDVKSLQLWRKNQVLWKTSVQEDLLCFHKSVLFSPAEENVVIYGAPGSYVLDAASGKVIRQLENMDVDDIKFISNEDCIVGLNDPRALCLRLYNVKSGDLLSEIVEQRQFRSLAVCPRKRLVAIGFENSADHFEIIQAKLPGDKEKTNIERSVETKFI